MLRKKIYSPLKNFGPIYSMLEDPGFQKSKLMFGSFYYYIIILFYYFNIFMTEFESN